MWHKLINKRYKYYFFGGMGEINHNTKSYAFFKQNLIYIQWYLQLAYTDKHSLIQHDSLQNIYRLKKSEKEIKDLSSCFQQSWICG